MNEQEAKKEAKRIVESFKVFLMYEIELKELSKYSIKCALLEVQSNIDLLELMKPSKSLYIAINDSPFEFRKTTMFDEEIDNLKQVKAQINKL